MASGAPTVSERQAVRLPLFRKRRVDCQREASGRPAATLSRAAGGVRGCGKPSDSNFRVKLLICSTYILVFIVVSKKLKYSTIG